MKEITSSLGVMLLVKMIYDESNGIMCSRNKIHKVEVPAVELDKARESVRGSLGGGDCEVIFTASGSEANNLAIVGRALAKERFRRGGIIISTMGEHASVSEPLRRLTEMGFTVEYLPTLRGEIDFERLEQLLCERVILVTAMMVNNETGAL